MKLNKVKLALMKYKVKSLRLSITPKMKHTVPSELIMSMNIVEDYDNYWFPYFTIKISVPNKVYRSMKAHSQTLKANLLIQKGKFKEGVVLNTETKRTFRNAVRGLFYVFMVDTSPDTSEKEQKLIEKSGNPYGDFVTIELMLYPNKYYKLYESVVNTCLTNVTLAEALTFTLNQVKARSVLLSPPTNYKKYKQFILTPIPLNKQLSRICNTYAIHKKGTLIFFGLDKLFIIDKQPKCTAYTTNEYKISYLVSGTTSKGVQQVGGCYSNAAKKYNVLNVVSIEIQNQKELAKRTVGTNVVSVNSRGKVTKTNKKTTKTTRVVVQEDGNSTATSLKRSIRESKRVLTVGMNDIDINMLTPNKQFIMTFDAASYKKYNGKYRLTKVTHIFQKEGNYFSVSTSAEFKG